MLYEIRDVNRFENIGYFVSYARRVAAKIGRVAYWIMQRKQPFDARQFWKNSLPKGVRTMEGAATKG